MKKKLVAAIENNDRESVRACLDTDPSLATADLPPGKDPWAVSGWKPLHLAAWRGETEIAALLLERGAQIDALDGGGRMPLHNAIEAGGQRIVDLLLERGATLDICSAAILGKQDRMQVLLKKDASLANDGTTGLSPLGWAAFGNRADSAKLLLEHGADGKEPEPLFCAASVNGTSFLELMLQQGVDPNVARKGCSLLHWTVRMRYTCDASPAASLLLENGADPNVLDSQGKTPLDLALQGAEEEKNKHPSAPPEECKRFDKMIEILRRHGGKTAAEMARD